MQRNFNFFYAFLLALLGLGVTLMAEEITLTTYYPAPYGAYDELIVSGNVGIGTTASPTERLHMYSNSNEFNYIKIENDSAAGILGDCGVRLKTRNSDFSVLVNDETNTFIISNSGAGAGHEIFTIDSSEHIKIGGDDWADDSANTLSVDGNMSIGTSYIGQWPVTPGTAAPANSLIVEGSVSVGTSSPGAYKCYINGTGYLNAAAWAYSSDARLKENISYIQSGLNIITQLQPVKFDYIQGEKRQAGFIAQEVEVVLPDIITKGQDGMLAMKTDSIIPYLVKAIQEQQKEIEALKARLNIK